MRVLPSDPWHVRLGSAALLATVQLTFAKNKVNRPLDNYFADDSSVIPRWLGGDKASASSGRGGGAEVGDGALLRALKIAYTVDVVRTVTRGFAVGKTVALAMPATHAFVSQDVVP